MTPDPCRCPAPNADCRRAGLPMVGALWRLCSGAGCAAGKSEAYRALWDALARGDRPPPTPRTTAPGPAARPGDCVHLGATPLSRTDAAGTPCLCPGLWLRPCGIHGACRVNDARGPAKSCQTCDDYESDRIAP